MIFMYHFNVAKQGLFVNSGTGSIFDRVYVKGICQKLPHQFKPNDVTIWSELALVCMLTLSPGTLHGW